MSISIRLQEIHPALVHLPIAMLPIAISADLAGRVNGDPRLLDIGRKGVEIAAAGALLAGLSGLVAQEEVNAEGESMDMLITHRNLNLAATIAVTAMASWRSRNESPSAGYLGLGIAAISAVVYTAYLGGKLVYEHGVGVAPAGGQYRSDAPRLGVEKISDFLGAAAVDLANGTAHLVRELAGGKLAPSLGIGPTAQRSGRARPLPTTAPSPATMPV